MTLAAIAEKLRKRTTAYRHDTRGDTQINMPIIIVEIALGLTELALDTNRPITQDEEDWFNESWNIIHRLENTEYDDIIDLYRSLKFKLNERNWFRVY